MIALPPSVGIYLCVDLVDGRLGLDALAGLVPAPAQRRPPPRRLFVLIAGRRRWA